jgi:hypothetical protein
MYVNGLNNMANTHKIESKMIKHNKYKVYLSPWKYYLYRKEVEDDGVIVNCKLIYTLLKIYTSDDKYYLNTKTPPLKPSSNSDTGMIDELDVTTKIINNNMAYEKGGMRW